MAEIPTDPCAISKRYIYTHRLLTLSSALEVHSSLVQVLSYACGQPDPLRASLPTSSLAFDRVDSKSWQSSGCDQSTLGKFRVHMETQPAPGSGRNIWDNVVHKPLGDVQQAASKYSTAVWYGDFF